MGREWAIINFIIVRRDGNQELRDLEVPLYITANELLIGLNEAYQLGIDTDNIRNCCLKVENPIVLLRGDKLLSECQIINGSRIMFDEREA